MNVLQTFDPKKYYGSEPTPMSGNVIVRGDELAKKNDKEVADHDMAF